MSITFVYVTHDQEEALTMSDTVVVMTGGKIQQIGSPQDIYNEPKNAFVARLYRRLQHRRRRHAARTFWSTSAAMISPVWTAALKLNEPVQVVIRPEDVQIVPPSVGYADRPCARGHLQGRSL